MKKFFALILALSLTLALVACGGGGGPAEQLKGTWKGEFFGIEMKMTFTADEVTMDMGAIGEAESESETAKYTVDSNNKLTLTAEGTEDTVIEYGEKAKEGDGDYWFIDGKTLYISGMELTKG